MKDFVFEFIRDFITVCLLGTVAFFVIRIIETIVGG